MTKIHWWWCTTTPENTCVTSAQVLSLAQFRSAVCPFQSILYWGNVQPTGRYTPNLCRTCFTEDCLARTTNSVLRIRVVLIGPPHHTTVHPAIIGSSPWLSGAVAQLHNRLSLCLQCVGCCSHSCYVTLFPVGLYHVITSWLATGNMVQGFLSSTNDQLQCRGENVISRAGASS